jgi:hypothetical protein
MQNKFLSMMFAAAVLGTGVRAQNAPDTTSATPAAQATAPTSAPAPQVIAQAPQAAPAPNQIIYSPRLPTAGELTSVAAAQGLTVQQITQTANQVTAIYRNANGELTTVAYQLLPTSGAPATVAVPSPAPTVVYQQAPSVVYYRTYDRPYDPYWPRYYPPVSLSLGFGYGWGGGGHYRHWR